MAAKMSAVFALDSLLHNDETLDLTVLTWDRAVKSFFFFAVDDTVDVLVWE